MRDDTLFREWVALAKKVDVLDAARERGAKLKKGGVGEWVGPCPGCGGRDRFGVNTRKQVFICRAGGVRGTVIDMMMHVAGVDFIGACEMLTKQPPPRGESTLDRDAIAARREQLRIEQAERAARQAHEQAIDDEKRRARAWEIYRCGVPALGTVVTRYLEARGIDPRSPATCRLRLLHDAPYWYEIDGRNRIIHTGPAMMSAIQAVDGRFMGVHLTWLEADGSDKLALFAPDTGEKLKVKKFRGLAKGGAIRLTGDVPGDVLLVGEGKETTWSAYDPLRRERPDLSLAAWAAASLDNLGGGGVGLQPGMNNPGFLPPAWAKKIIILGDGDSDPTKVREQTERCRRRCALLNVPAAVAMAVTDKDFNDMLRGL